MPLLEARNLHLRFGDRVVLEDVSLSFEEGRLSGIMGPNGAGKTTFFNVLTGRYRPDRGQVLLEGQDITGRSPQAIARLGIARSFQIMSLFDEFTVFENVAIALPRLRARARLSAPDKPMAIPRSSWRLMLCSPWWASPSARTISPVTALRRAAGTRDRGRTCRQAEAPVPRRADRGPR